MNKLELIEKINKGEKFNYTFFWGAKKSTKLTNSVFSQWYPASFIEDDITYCCCEQYMMAKKASLFNDEETLKEIMNETDPKKIKALGRKVKNFDDKIWKLWCDEIVFTGNYLKFSQNEDLKHYLLSTNDNILVEASPYDKIWGIGLKKEDKDATNPLVWPGENRLGFILTNVKEKIKST